MVFIAAGHSRRGSNAEDQPAAPFSCTKTLAKRHRYRKRSRRGFPMRLTLRTLLAYLDDTLGPEEAREIGRKVAQSAAAQELIERIKKVTRRRGLKAPSPTTDDPVTDPNTVAEYLDNVLPSDDLTQ